MSLSANYLDVYGERRSATTNKPSPVRPERSEPVCYKAKIESLTSSIFAQKPHGDPDMIR